MRKKYLTSKKLLAIFSFITVVGLIGMLSSCTPTYPKEKLPEAVKQVCKLEYNMDVDVTLVGQTIGIYYPMKGLLDVGLGVSEEAWDTISDLLLIASRVVLSTDADIKFYCVITQDTRLPELQVAVIKYVDDVKRSMYRNISRSEAFKRTLFSINLTPQAKKERSIEQIFNKLSVEPATRQKVMDEFFRSPPTKLSDIGYWKGKFYLKNITLQEFLAEQMVNRMKLDFKGDEDLNKLYSYKAAESSFEKEDGKGNFIIKFKIQDQQKEGEESLRQQKIREIIEIANKVVRGYKFEDFNFLILEDQLENAKLVISGSDVYNFNREKLSVKEVVKAPVGYF